MCVWAHVISHSSAQAAVGSIWLVRPESHASAVHLWLCWSVTLQVTRFCSLWIWLWWWCWWYFLHGMLINGLWQEPSISFPSPSLYTPPLPPLLAPPLLPHIGSPVPCQKLSLAYVLPALSLRWSWVELKCAGPSCMHASLPANQLAPSQKLLGSAPVMKARLCGACPDDFALCQNWVQCSCLLSLPVHLCDMPWYLTSLLIFALSLCLFLTFLYQFYLFFKTFTLKSYHANVSLEFTHNSVVTNLWVSTHGQWHDGVKRNITSEPECFFKY